MTQLERLDVLTRHLTGAPAQWTDITQTAMRDGLPDMPGPPGDYLLRNLASASREPDPPTTDVAQLLGRDATHYTSWVQQGQG